MVDRYRILVLNNISQTGLQRFPDSRYLVDSNIANPDAIVLRSQDLNSMSISLSVKAIARAGAGTNNIPVQDMSKRGVPVFNAPGANANAVKELVIAGMLIAARNLLPALHFTASLQASAVGLDERIESSKKNFTGTELVQHTIGIIGLGKIGSLVANAAIHLGMRVLGYDPEITVEAAWSLPSQVKKARSIEDVLRNSDFITVHVPLSPETEHLIDSAALRLIRPRSVLLNFSRKRIVDEEAVLAALAEDRLSYYVCDFPSARALGNPKVIALPHLGASTKEAEENSAVMVVDQLRDYLEHGNIQNAVNFPTVVLPRESPYRLAIANANVPNMLGQISSCVAAAGINIHDMINKSKEEMAYTIVDLDSDVSAAVIESLVAIRGVLGVRYIPTFHHERS